MENRKVRLWIEIGVATCGGIIGGVVAWLFSRPYVSDLYHPQWDFHVPSSVGLQIVFWAVVTGLALGWMAARKFTRGMPASLGQTSSLGAELGGQVGMASGLIAGTILCPIVGTIIGLIIGTITGVVSGMLLGRIIFAILRKRQDRTEAQKNEEEEQTKNEDTPDKA